MQEQESSMIHFPLSIYREYQTSLFFSLMKSRDQTYKKPFFCLMIIKASIMDDSTSPSNFKHRAHHPSPWTKKAQRESKHQHDSHIMK